MALRNLRAIIGPLELPIGDKTYTIPPLSAEWGVRFRLAAEGADDPEIKEMPHGRELELFLGPALQEMRDAPDVFDDDIEHAWLTALAEFTYGRATAERTWEAGPNPNLLASLREAAAKAKGSPDSTPSPNSAKASARGSRASTSPTTSRQATPRRARKTATPRASAGTRSSSNGKSS